MHRRALGTLAASFVVALPAAAQIRASELGGVWQTIDGTKLTMEYSRPRVRGRSPLFGNPRIVKWNETWTPGANYATTLDVSRDVTLDGHRVPKGKYSIWFVVRENGPWTAVLDTNAHRFHMRPPDSSATQVRFPVTPKTGAFSEVLTWAFTDIRANGGTLTFQWGTTLIAFDIGVQPSLSVGLTESEARPYVGRYEFTDKDSTGKSTTYGLVLLYENGTLKGEFDPADPYMKRFAMIRVAPDWFVPGLYDEKGSIYEVLRPDMMVQFRRENGRPTKIEVRDDQDNLEFTATRKP